MNPSASPFTPGPTPPPDNKAEELRRVNQSLCKALAQARQAQNAAEVALNAAGFALQEETTKRAKAEEEVKSLLKTNSSLASTAQMLRAIVKHNITPEATATSSEVSSAIFPQEKALSQVINHLLIYPLI
jgi:hypothetical protein